MRPTERCFSLVQMRQMWCWELQIGLTCATGVHGWSRNPQWRQIKIIKVNSLMTRWVVQSIEHLSLLLFGSVEFVINSVCTCRKKASNTLRYFTRGNNSLSTWGEQPIFWQSTVASDFKGADSLPKEQLDRRTGAASAVMWTLYRTVLVRKELSQKAKLSIYHSVYVPTLTYGHKRWVVTEIMRFGMRGAEGSLLCRRQGLALDQGVEFGRPGGAEVWTAAPLLPFSQLRWLL